MSVSGLPRQLYRSQIAAHLQTPAAKQLVRYVIAGLCVTQFAAAIYSLLVLYFSVHPLQANLISTSAGISVGYLAHSRWSFAGGAADNEYGKITRFVVTSLTALAVNSTWVWLFVSVLALPPLSPLPLMMCVTPWISFLLNRQWVFRAAQSPAPGGSQGSEKQA